MAANVFQRTPDLCGNFSRTEPPTSWCWRSTSCCCRSTRASSARTQYGALALLLVCEAVVKIVYRWGLDSGFLRLYYDYPDDAQRKTLAGTITVFLAVVDGSLTLLLLATAVPANMLIFGTEDFVGAYRLLVLNMFASTFLFLPLNLLRIQERSTLFSSITFLRSFGTVLIRVLLVVGLGFGVFGIFLADLVVTGALMVALGGTFRGMLARRFSMAVLRDLLAFGMPQVPFGLLNQAMSMADRFILGLYMPLRTVGLYLIGTTIAGVIKFYPVAFEAAWMPFAYDSLKRDDAAPLFARLGTYAFAILALFTVALAGLAPPLVRLALPPEYHQVAPLIPILTLAMAVQALSWFMVTSLNVAKQTRVYPVVTAIGAAASVGTNLLLIPSLGMFGAALALLLSQTLTSAVTLYFAQRAYPIPYELGRLSKASGIAALIYGAMTLAPSASPWQSLVVRTALLALFPLGLLLLRFFHPREIGELRRLMESRIPA